MTASGTDPQHAAPIGTAIRGHAADLQVIRQHRRRIGRWLGLIGVATAVTTSVVALLPGTSQVPVPMVLGLLALTLPASLTVLVAAGRDDALLVAALRALLGAGLVAVVVGTALAPADDVVGLAFLGFLFLLGAVSLPLREHVALVAVGTLAGCAVVVVQGATLGAWPLLASVATGALSHAAARGYRSTLEDLEREHAAAESASAALRAVVAGAGEATTGDLSEVLDAVVRAVGALDCEMSSVALFDPDGTVRQAASHGLPDAEVDEVHDNRQGLSTQVALHGATIVRNDYQAYEHRIPTQRFADVHAAMGTPIRVDGQLVGVLVAARRRGGAFDAAAVDAVELLAAHAGRAIALARAVGQDRATLLQLQHLRQLQEDFVSTVSHELRTPLTVINGAAETLVQRGDRLSPELQSQLLSRVAANARSLDVVIEGILELSRLDRGLAEFSPEPIDVHALVLAAVERCAAPLEDHRVDLDLEAVGAIGETDLLDRALDNLLLNAGRHTPPGTRVRVTARRLDDGVEIAVSDEGPGIAAHDLPHLTERFRRAGPTTTRGVRGLGIGLSLVAHVLRIHGSRLDVTSTPGEGATFAFRLAPTDRPPTAAGAGAADGHESVPDPDDLDGAVTGT